MRTTIAIALAASYAAAAGTKIACDGYFVSLVADGWECTFKADGTAVDKCTKKDSAGTAVAYTTVVGTGVAAYEAACVDGATTYSWAKPSADLCDTYTKAAKLLNSDYKVDATEKKNVLWISACYGGAVNLTVLGAAAVAAIAALAF